MAAGITERCFDSCFNGCSAYTRLTRPDAFQFSRNASSGSFERSHAPTRENRINRKARDIIAHGLGFLRQDRQSNSRTFSLFIYVSSPHPLSLVFPPFLLHFHLSFLLLPSCPGMYRSARILSQTLFPVLENFDSVSLRRNSLSLSLSLSRSNMKDTSATLLQRSFRGTRCL